jgi:hypothetical protein
MYIKNIYKQYLGKFETSDEIVLNETTHYGESQYANANDIITESTPEYTSEDSETSTVVQTEDRFLISVNLVESYKNDVPFDVTVNGTSKEHMISLLQNAITKIENLDELTLAVN